MRSTRWSFALLTLFLTGALLGSIAEPASAQYRRGYSRRPGAYGRYYRGTYGYGRGYYPRAYLAPAPGYYFGGSYRGGGRYGRPWGYSYPYGYLPGYGAFFGSSYYGSGFGYSTYGGYCP